MLYGPQLRGCLPVSEKGPPQRSVRGGDCLGLPAPEGSAEQIHYNSPENLKTDIWGLLHLTKGPTFFCGKINCKYTFCHCFHQKCLWKIFN